MKNHRAVSLLAFVVLIACDNPQPPVSCDPLPQLSLTVGESHRVTACFDDPNEDILVYMFQSSNPEVASAARIARSSLLVQAISPGQASITITATDPGGLEGQTSFQVVVPNRPPARIGMIPRRKVGVGRSVDIDASQYFTEPDGQTLTYTAISEDIGVATVSIASDVLTVNAVAAGPSGITVTASDPGGLSVDQGFQVEVLNQAFEIELVFVNDISPSYRKMIEGAVTKWEQILAHTEFEDYLYNRDVDCWGHVEWIGVVDDVRVAVEVVDIEGETGPFGSGGPCWIRRNSMPIKGLITLNASRMEWMVDEGILEAVMLHELGHVLGVGTIWRNLGFLQNPSRPDCPECDTFFSGALAIEAFNNAGGSTYEGRKVPIESGARLDDFHWRESVMGVELMTPRLRRGDGDYLNRLSAITIQSLADMGYLVDLSLADPYSLPSASARGEYAKESIDLGDDVMHGPIMVADERGRIVQIIQR